MEIEHLKNIGQKLISAVVPGGGNSCNLDEVQAEGTKKLKALENAVTQCKSTFGGKTILATDENPHVADMCNRWAHVLSHGLKVPVATYQPIQNLITAGLNFAFNLNLFDVSLWDYTRIHLTRHEEERFKLLKNINTPIGHFKAFLRSALNERSLERYIRSWISHNLLIEYYEDWAIVRNPKISNRLCDMASDLSTILFAMSIDKTELNDSQSPVIQTSTSVEPIIAISAPITKNTNQKTLRQVISFDSNEDKQLTSSKSYTNFTDQNSGSIVDLSSVQASSSSLYEDESRDVFFGDDSIDLSDQNAKDTPREILSRLTEKAKDIFSRKRSTDSMSHHDSDLSSISGDNKKFSESDIDDLGLEREIACLELNYPIDDLIVNGVEDVSKLSQQNSALKHRIAQLENDHDEKVSQMEKVIHNLNSENEKLKEQLRNYVSAVESLNQENIPNDEIRQYELKLVQVAQMHAELMEFNNMLQQQIKTQSEEGNSNCSMLRNYSGNTSSDVNILIPSTYLVSKGNKSFHVYQIYLKIRSEEWNVYRRYSEFRKLHCDLKNTHPNVSSFKFPPKKVLGKKEAWLVEQRRGQLQAWLRHIVDALPQLHQCTKRLDLITLLPFFSEAGYSENSGVLRPIAST